MVYPVESSQSASIEAPASHPGVLTILAGPTASGKNAVLDGILERYSNMRRVVSTTTRPPAGGEVDGVDYHFVSEADFKTKLAEGKFLETVQYGDQYYGSQIKDIEPVLGGQDLIWIVNMGRAFEIEKYYRFALNLEIAQAIADRTLLVLIGVPNILNLRSRFNQRKRGSKENFLKRMKEDWTVWQDHRDDFPHVLINGEGQLADTISGVVALVEQRRAELSQEQISSGDFHMA